MQLRFQIVLLALSAIAKEKPEPKPQLDIPAELREAYFQTDAAVARAEQARTRAEAAMMIYCGKDYQLGSPDGKSIKCVARVPSAKPVKEPEGTIKEKAK